MGMKLQWEMIGLQDWNIRWDKVSCSRCCQKIICWNVLEKLQSENRSESLVRDLFWNFPCSPLVSETGRTQISVRGAVHVEDERRGWGPTPCGRAVNNNTDLSTAEFTSSWRTPEKTRLSRREELIKIVFPLSSMGSVLLPRWLQQHHSPPPSVQRAEPGEGAAPVHQTSVRGRVGIAASPTSCRDTERSLIIRLQPVASTSLVWFHLVVYVHFPSTHTCKRLHQQDHPKVPDPPGQEAEEQRLWDTLTRGTSSNT